MPCRKLAGDDPSAPMFWRIINIYKAKIPFHIAGVLHKPKGMSSNSIRPALVITGFVIVWIHITLPVA
jgi:hypothetical protein